MEFINGYTDENGLKELWFEAFGDSFRFTEMLRKNGFISQESIYSAVNGNKTVAALNSVKYPFNFFGKTKIEYICSAATAKAYRGQNIMSRLMEFALRSSAKNGSVFAGLIPAEESLFGFYEKSGFAGVFAVSKNTASPYDNFIGTSAFQSYTNKYSHINLACFKNEKRFLQACEEYSENMIKTETGIAFLNVTDSDVTVREYSGFTLNELTAEIKKRFGNVTVTVENPPCENDETFTNGMCRILNLEKVLKKLCADENAEFSFEINDPIIETNNITFILSDGNVSAAKNAEKISIKEFTEIIFKKYGPGYINGILN